MEDIYLQHRPNHQQPNYSTAHDVNLHHQSQLHPQAPQMQREASGQQQHLSIHSAPPEFLNQQQQLQSQQNFSSVPDDQVEKVTHTFDNFGRPISNREEGTGVQVTADDPEAWNFEEQILDGSQGQEAPAVQARY